MHPSSTYVLRSLIAQEDEYVRLADALGIRGVSSGGKSKLVFDVQACETKHVTTGLASAESPSSSLRFRVCSGRLGVPVDDLWAAGFRHAVQDVHPYSSNGIYIVYLNPARSTLPPLPSRVRGKTCPHGKIMFDPQQYRFCSIGCKLDNTNRAEEGGGNGSTSSVVRNRGTKRKAFCDEKYMRSVAKMYEQLTVSHEDASRDVQMITALSSSSVRT